MNLNNLSFNVRDILKVDGQEYSVEGYISFINESDNSKWTEYKLNQRQSNEIKWLSIDGICEKYTIYSQCNYKNAFSEENLVAEGYKEIENGTARVIDYSGDVDVDINENVYYKEFEDSNGFNVIAIEEWGFEIEYSTGYHIESHKIEKISSSHNRVYEKENIANKYKTNNLGKFLPSGNIARLCSFGIVGIVIIVIVAIMNSGNKTAMSEFITSSSNYTYTTSITSDGEGKEKADVYSTTFSIEQAAKNIIDGINGDVSDVQENTEDLSVAILTEDEYCLVYSDEEGKTLVQISTRLYAYSSNQQPYRSRPSTANYFRRYYYSRGYSTDSSKYSSNRNAYSSYSDGTINSNSSDKYKSYSDTTRASSKSSGKSSSTSSSSSSSARQSSSGSRTSSGGGTSSGK